MTAPLSFQAMDSSARRAWLAGSLLTTAARGIALFVSGFSLLNLLIQSRTSGFDANQWWIDFRPLPHWVQTLMLLIGSVILLAYVFVPQMSPWRRRATLTVCELLGLIAIWNVLEYYYLLARSVIYSGSPIPFSILVILALLVVWRGAARREQSGNGGPAWAVILCVFGLCMFVFPLAQMLCFGTTDYRRPADAIVVFGAPVEPDGSPSEALQDRVNLGVELYQQKLGKKLIFTGGQGPDEPINEAELMRRMAMDAGIPSADIEMDRDGTTTASSVDDTGYMLRDLADEQPASFAGRAVRVLVVSHFYQLPRIKIEYQREQLPPHYLQILTVPVRSSLARLPRYMGREVVAQWAYYLGPLLKGE